ncbi:MAG TPA: preprotein translocase subunit SecG [Phycisphaerales bacterium]|nr:preprotein translocase subunit SecG [Phycisphaerales bacterium]
MDPTFGMLTLGAASWLIGLLSVAFLFCSVLLVLTVLIQRPQGGGLSGAFGAGAGSGETAFGARTGDALTIATISFFVLWLVVAVGLVWVMQPQGVAPIGAEAASTEPTTEPATDPDAPAGNQATPPATVPAEGGQPAPQEGEPPVDQPAGDPDEGGEQTGGAQDDTADSDGDPPGGGL